MTDLKLQQCRLDGRYDILDCLKRGSYAEIYVALDMAATDGAPQKVVIKALNVHLQGTPDAELERTLIENFQNEAVALDRVRHPNIISRLGHGTAIDLADMTFHYLVLEYMGGGDMEERCRQHPFTLERTLFYLEQVSAGLQHAHDCGVIHRDIKPQNLLLTADEQTIKIADFGVAKLEATEGAITRVGTNVYAAPEHNPLVHTGPLDGASQTGSLRHLTPAADIYSLAKTTYTLLVGEPPRRFSHRPITEFPAPVADEVWATAVLRVLGRATQQRPSDRHQSVEEFWAELSDAALPPTQPLHPQQAEVLPRMTGSLVRVKGAVTDAPPRPQFNPTRLVEQAPARPVSSNNGKSRPRIVVRLDEPDVAAPLASRSSHMRVQEALGALPDAPAKKDYRSERASQASAIRRALVALVLIAAFAGMLLATRYYFQSRWSARTSQPPAAPAPSIVGRQGTIVQTDVNLRPDPSTDNSPVGVAEIGSRVRVLSTSGNWREIEILQHGRDKEDPESADRGWITQKYLKLD